MVISCFFFKAFRIALLNNHEHYTMNPGQDLQILGNLNLNQAANNHPAAISSLLGSAQKVGLAHMSAITCGRKRWILCTCVSNPTHSLSCWWYQHGAHTCIHTYTHIHTHAHTHAHTYTQIRADAILFQRTCALSLRHGGHGHWLENNRDWNIMHDVALMVHHAGAITNNACNYLTKPLGSRGPTAPANTNLLPLFWKPGLRSIPT